MSEMITKDHALVALFMIDFYVTKVGRAGASSCCSAQRVVALGANECE